MYYLTKSIHGITNYSTLICPFPFESGKCEKEKKNKNLNILQTKRAFSTKEKTLFLVFEGL